METMPVRHSVTNSCNNNGAGITEWNSALLFLGTSPPPATIQNTDDTLTRIY